MKNPSVGRTIAGCAIGLVLALLTPFLLPFAALISVITIAILLVYAYFGAVSAAFGATACCVSAGVLFGALGVWAALFVCVLPAAVGCLLLWGRAAYTVRMKTALIAQTVGAAAFLLVASLSVGGDLADALTNMIYEQVTSMPAGFADYYLSMLGYVENAPASIDLFNGFIDAAERETLLREAVDTQNLALKVNLPALIASSCLYTGLLACHLPSRALARRGEDIDHMSLGKWRIGRELTIVSVLLYATGLYFFAFSTADAAVPASFTLTAIPQIVFTMQGLAAADRAFLKVGHSRTRRSWSLVGLFALGMVGLNVLALMGVASALWGSQGIFTLRRKRKKGGGDGGHTDDGSHMDDDDDTDDDDDDGNGGDGGD